MTAEVRVLGDAGAFYRAAAEEFVRAAESAKQDLFTVALAGGSTPRELYTLLARDPALRASALWQRSHFFWGDERHVPPDHPDSNYRMARETLLENLRIPPAQISRVESELPSAADAAERYERELQRVFGLPAGAKPRFDLVLLGMGPEGHTASLFPGTRALHEIARLAAANWVGKLFTDRITLTAPVLNNAACVIFLVRGEEKALALKGVLEGPYEPEQLPAQLIRPTAGRLVWLLDRSAASLLASRP